MTSYVGPTVESLLRRIREQGGFALSEDFATEILSICQRVVNIKMQSVVETKLMPTKAEKLIYWTRTELPLCADVLDVKEEGRSLVKCDSLMDLGNFDADWFRKIDGTRFEAWHTMSRDLFILYPGKASASVVSVDYVKLTARHTNFSDSYNSEMELDESGVEFASLLAETVLLARSRKFSTLEKKLKRLENLLNG